MLPDYTMGEAEMENAAEMHAKFVKKFLNDLKGKKHHKETPRCLPFEFDLSDGMELGASLDFLVDAIDGDIKQNLRSQHSRKSVFSVGGMIALTKKQFPGAGGGFLLHARATSGLTNMDYLRFSILCPESTQEIVDTLIADRKLAYDDAYVSDDESEAIMDLLDVLTWARIIVVGLLRFKTVQVECRYHSA
jgi:hypothetical protein